MTELIRNPIIEKVMNDGSWEYENGLLDGYSPGEIENAIEKALSLQQEKITELIDEYCSEKYGKTDMKLFDLEVRKELKELIQRQ